MSISQTENRTCRRRTRKDLGPFLHASYIADVIGISLSPKHADQRAGDLLTPTLLHLMPDALQEEARSNRTRTRSLILPLRDVAEQVPGLTQLKN